MKVTDDFNSEKLFDTSRVYIDADDELIPTFNVMSWMYNIRPCKSKYNQKTNVATIKYKENTLSNEIKLCV